MDSGDVKPPGSALHAFATAKSKLNVVQVSDSTFVNNTATRNAVGGDGNGGSGDATGTSSVLQNFYGAMTLSGGGALWAMFRSGNSNVNEVCPWFSCLAY